MGNFAQILDGKVVNLVIGESAEQLKSILPDYTFVEMTSGIHVEINDYYNPADGLFYEDPEFTKISGYVEPPTANQIYDSLVLMLQSNAEGSAQDVKKPYSNEEVQTWWCQLEEAQEYTASSSYVPVMLNSMVSASGGGWTLEGLAANIISNGNAWKAAAGNILGQVKAKTVALNALKAEVDAGTKTVADLQAFDCTITTPTVSLEDKFA